MPHSLPSRAWSCQTLQAGLNLVGAMSLSLDSLGEADIEAMQKELAQLEVGVPSGLRFPS